MPPGISASASQINSLTEKEEMLLSENLAVSLTSPSTKQPPHIFEIVF